VYIHIVEVNHNLIIFPNSRLDTVCFFVRCNVMFKLHFVFLFTSSGHQFQFNQRTVTSNPIHISPLSIPRTLHIPLKLLLNPRRRFLCLLLQSKLFNPLIHPLHQLFNLLSSRLSVPLSFRLLRRSEEC
jgi:hypothetical protein